MLTGRICAAQALSEDVTSLLDNWILLNGYHSKRLFIGSTLITLYGISNCDSVKKAKKWLGDNEIVYVFHDFRADGLTTEQIKHWLEQVPREKLLNKRSTTWKQLPDGLKNELTADNAAESLFIDTMREYPTLIKRPVLAISNDNIQVGFSAADYQQLID